MNPLEDRCMRLKWILKICKEAQNKEYVIAQLGIVHGIARRTSQEYIQQLLTAGKLEAEGPNVRAA